MALAEVFEAFAGPDTPVEFTAYDGSHSGKEGSDVKVTVRSPVAVAYLAQAPGELGLARAYVSGHLDIDGDMYEALVRMRRAQSISMGVGEKLRLLRALGGPKLLLHRIPPPPQEISVHRRWTIGPLHSKGRDARAISHHYDVSNRFYEWVLGPTMAYTCACYPREDATLEEAQANKFDLVARKLGLRPGMRLLDVGCGWGGMVMHAAREYGVKALGVTLSAQQAAWAQAAIEREGLSGLAEVRHLDYRDVPGDGLRRGQLDRADRARRQGQPPGLLRVPVRQAEPRRPAAQPLHHPAGQHRAGHPQAGVHQQVRLPRRRARGTRLPDLAHARRGLRGPARGEPARALREDPGGLVREPGRALGRGGQGGRPGHRPGVAAVHGGLAARVRHATTSSCTRCSASGCTRTGHPACRCGPTGRPRGFSPTLSRTGGGSRPGILTRAIAVPPGRLRLPHARDGLAGQQVDGRRRGHERPRGP